jgi:hypothetical protein
MKHEYDVYMQKKFISIVIDFIEDWYHVQELKYGFDSNCFRDNKIKIRQFFKEFESKKKIEWE